jgi:hypothetical protein
MHAYNPSYREADIGGLRFKASLTKMLVRFKEQAGCAGTCLSSQLCRDVGRRIVVRGWPQDKA